jgi:hypothetical protein
MKMTRTFNPGWLRAFVAAVALLGVSGEWKGALAASQDDRSDANGLTVIGLTADGRLVRFATNAPDRTQTIGPVAGLSGTDTSLVGIDFRVQDGKLYGVGNGGGVYTIDTTTGVAQFVNALTVPLSGTSFGVDFNPAADRLRIISDSGQNLAHNVNAGGVTAANAALTYTAPPATPVTAMGVTGAAYTNNDLPPAGTPTATTLFDIDTTMDQVVIQSPPGNGILVATGRLGFNARLSAGFDIYSRIMGGVTVDNWGYAVLVTGEGRRFFFAVNLLTGKTDELGPLNEAVVDIALPLNQ